MDLRSRKYSLAFLGFLYLLIIYASYRALYVLGPLDPSLLRFDNDPMEHGYKIFFFSMQFGGLTYIAFLTTLIGSIGYLKTRAQKYDIIASNAAKLALVFATIVLVNGAIFSNLAWGAYWNWDPRQTTTLMLWFILTGYLALRTAIEDEETRARLSAILGIFGFATVPLTLFSTTIWTTNHPQLVAGASGSGFSLDKAGLQVFMMMFLGAIMIYFYLLWLSVRIENLERKAKEMA
ncbi:MAG: cytochrome c biogenesis protein [Desulfatiglandales bacterium]